jgi:hypothetical protein
MRVSSRLVLAALAAASILLAGLAAASAAGITTITPKPHATIKQNDASTGCPFDPNRGYGYQVSFSWDAPAGIAVDHYEVSWQHTGQDPRALFDTSATASVFEECNSFVADANLMDWNWWVVAYDAANNELAHSDLSPFKWVHCKVHGSPCSAPPSP